MAPHSGVSSGAPPQLDLFRSPFYLKLLLAQIGARRTPATGHAALFTGFVRQALRREVERQQPAVSARARCWTAATTSGSCAASGAIRTIFPPAAPRSGALRPRLRPAGAARRGRSLAGPRARRRGTRAAGRGRMPRICSVPGWTLQVLEVQWDDVFFVHQLLQEYFAARAVAPPRAASLVRTAWRATEMSPSLEAGTAAGSRDSDPLPAAPATGWEETFVLAAAMVPDAGRVRAARWPRRICRSPVAAPPSPRCRSRPSCASGSSRRSSRAAATRPPTCARASPPPARSGSWAIRASSAAAGPTGTTCCRRWWRSRAATYPIGSDEGLYEDEAPAHSVTLAPSPSASSR